MITWRPIAELPDELKDGREVLLWVPPEGIATATWIDDDRNGFWSSHLRFNPDDVTHFAEINAPHEGTDVFTRDCNDPNDLGRYHYEP